MGIYDTVTGEAISIQLKSTPDPYLHDYKVGEDIPLVDGIHIGYEGAAVVKDGRVIMVTNIILDKWGGVIDPGKVIYDRNPVVEGIREAMGEATGETT